MGLFTRLFGWVGWGKPPEPDDLRQQLLAAQGPAALRRLCRRHAKLIRQHFPGWRTVPEQVRANPDQAQHYMDGLVAVAQTFANSLGDPALMQLLLGPPGSNPMERWHKRLDEARQLMEDLRYRDAATLLTDLLIDVRGLKGSGVDAFMPATLGSLGECYFQQGEAMRAIAPTEQALEIVRRISDDEGIVAYLGNLYEEHRYLEQAEAAAGCADQLAEHHQRLGRADEARRYRGQVARVRAGEPRNRVVIDLDGRRLEVEEVLGGVEGRVRFVFERNKLTLRTADVYVASGQEEGKRGRYAQALELFREAARADPFAPHPHHEAAITLLHLDRAVEAVEEYERTEELAPGWFHCRSECWLARQIVLGQYGHDTFLLLRAGEDANLAPRARLSLLERGLAQTPELALLHHLRGKVLAESRRRNEAMVAYRHGLECAAEDDVHTRLLVDLAGLLEPGEERRRLLEEAVARNGNLVAVATARIMLAFE
jgi:tetratricopeptide (TPR) repeat protein